MTATVLPLPASYFERLGSSLEEKIFFLSRIPSEVTVFADFGCGDGRLLAEVETRRKTDALLGYDHHPSAFETCYGKTTQFTNSLPLFVMRLEAQRRAGHKICLILSSVVHEVLSQGTSWFKFWKLIREFNPDYIAIRDMACSIDATVKGPRSNMAMQLEGDDRMAASLLYNTAETGMFTTQAEVLEALLKYHYTENMQQELDESYFPLAAEQWFNLTNVGSGYQISYFDHHSVQWHRENWKRDFGLDIEDPTHIKIILKKV